MIYLLVNHIPWGKTADARTFRVGDMWLRDLRAQRDAITQAGGKLIVAAPLVDQLGQGATGGFNQIDIRPADEQIEFFPLPFFISMKQFWRVRGELKRQLRRAISRSDIVQLGYGGHPVAIGEIAWPIAAELGKKRIWLFDGADPFPRMQLHADSERNVLKRWAKRRIVKKFESFCRRAIRDADLVITHNAAVAQRFADVWNPRCHSFDRSFVTSDILLDEREMARRKESLLDSGSPLRLVVAGRQIRIKGTDHVLRAMAQAMQNGAKLTLDVIGDGEDLTEFKQLSNELGLNDSVNLPNTPSCLAAGPKGRRIVSFRGAVSYGQELFDAWTESQVMVITNLTAEISRNVLLAMARGLPLIMYRNPGTDDLVEQNDAGILAPAGDVAALSEAFVRAHRDRTRLVELAENGRRVAGRMTLDQTHRRRAELAAGVVAHAGEAELRPPLKSV